MLCLKHEDGSGCRAWNRRRKWYFLWCPSHSWQKNYTVIHTTHYTLHTAHCALCTKQCTPHTTHYTAASSILLFVRDNQTSPFPSLWQQPYWPIATTPTTKTHQQQKEQNNKNNNKKQAKCNIKMKKSLQLWHTYPDCQKDFQQLTIMPASWKKQRKHRTF